jgi:hypothetical protein
MGWREQRISIAAFIFKTWQNKLVQAKKEVVDAKNDKEKREAELKLKSIEENAPNGSIF